MARIMEEGCLLRVYVGGSDKHDGMLMHDWIVEQARAQGIAAATILRGAGGYGALNRIHAAKVLRRTLDLPVIVEIVDTVESVKRFVTLLDGVLKEGVATLERVEIRNFGKQQSYSPENEA